MEQEIWEGDYRLNFYSFHIGDYAGATRHLSWDEDMAYRRMLDAYYSREQPLPLDRRQIYRLVSASEKRQRDAVDAVLTEFFSEAPDGWRNTRADEEIGKALVKKEKARQSAAFRWGGDTKCEGNANAYANASPHAMRTHSEGNAPNPNPNPKRRGEVVARARDPDADLEARLRQAAGWQSDPSPMLAVTGPIRALIDAGADLELDVLPVIGAIAPKADGRSWNFFIKAIARARDQRISASTVVSMPTATASARSPSHAAHRKPTRDETFAAIDARIAAIAEAERRAAAGGQTDPLDHPEGAT